MKYMGRVDNKTALVTGAAQGLGAATAMMLAKEGASVICTDIDVDGLKRQVARINAAFTGSAVALQHDVTSQDQWRDVLLHIERKNGALHILVNNAGVGSVANIEEESFEQWRRVHSVDLDSVFHGCQQAIPLMGKSGGGSIINISSISGIIASHNLAAYNSAKAAVRHLTKSIALHCARERNKIRCNSLHPAFIDTPILDDMLGDADRSAAAAKLGRQIPLGHIGQPDDVAYAVIYLASDESTFITGTGLVIDGGISAM